MTRRPTTLAILALALTLVSCAGSANTNAAAKTPDHAAKSDYQKPVRMNGRGKISSISLSEFFTLHQSGKTLVYDARLAFFYHLGHIPGALNLPVSHCDDHIVSREAEIKAALAAGKTIVVYCTSPTCPDARSTAIHLSGFGYPASIFAGGWDAWKEAGMPDE